MTRENKIAIMKNRLATIENRVDAGKYTTVRHLKRRIRNLENNR